MLNTIKILAFKIFETIFFLKGINRWSVFVAENLANLSGVVKVDGKDVLFSTVNPILKYRLDTFYTKEVETIDWLNELKSNDVLYDIGANVGLYSIYAGIKGSRVLAFEPVYYNFSILNKNIAENNLGETVVAYPIALSSKVEFGKMSLSNPTPGGAFSSFETDGKNDGVIQQGSISFSLDDLVEKYEFPVPTAVKIDVDGLEAKIIEGMKEVLKNSKLRKVLIEIEESLPSSEGIIKTITEAGFQIERYGPYPDEVHKVRNYIFTKK